MYPGNPGMAGMNPYGTYSRQLDFSEIFRRVYLWLAVGLTIGFGVAFLVGQMANAWLANGQYGMIALIYNPIVMIVTIIAYLALAFTFYPVVRSASPAIGMTLYVLITAVFGFMSSSIFVVYTKDSIALAFFITATMFAIMTLIGFTTSVDLSKLGSILLMALIGVIVASLVNFFLHSALLLWIVSLASVVIFSGLTAYDTQWIKRNALSLATPYGTMADEVMVSRIALIGAFRLFLDFVNLFLSILRLTGSRRY